TSDLIFPELASERDDCGIVGQTLMSAIVALVLAGAVAIVFAICLVVLFVVAEQILQREAVMDGDVIDAGTRRAAVVIEQVGRAGHTAGDFADQAAFAAPVAPHRRTVTVIPFRPLRGKRTDLVATESQIPGFGDQLYRGEYRVLSHRGEEAAVAVKSVRAARQRGGEIESEAIHVADLDPVTQ